MSSWETGYGDFVLRPGLRHAAAAAVARGPALVIADLTWLDGAPVTASPRQILDRQVRRLAERGLVAMAGTELEFIVYRDSYGKRPARLPGPGPGQPVQRGLLDPGRLRVEPLLRKIRNGMTGAGMYVESAKGECNLGQHEIAFRYAGRPPPATTTRSTRPGPRRSPRRRA